MPFPFFWIGPDRKAVLPRSVNGLGQRCDDNAGVGGNHAVSVGEQRIDVQLPDLRDVRGHLSEFDQQQRDCVFIRSRDVAVALENARHAGA